MNSGSSWNKPVKMVLGGVVAGCTAITANNWFSESWRAWGGVVGAVAGAALLYLLDPSGGAKPAEVAVTNPPSDPVPIDPVNL